MNKDNVRELLINLKTFDNENAVNYLLDKLDQVSSEELNELFEQKNISENNIKEFLQSLIEKNLTQEETTENFIGVNDWFCYGRTGDTIHMHLIPKDLRGVKKELGDEGFYNLYKEQLKDFLSKMQALFLEDPSINSLFAVSPIFYNPNITQVHEDLGFNKVVEVDLNNENDNMSVEQKEYFLNMFNKGDNNKRVYYAKMTREELLENDYSQSTYLKH